MEKKYGNKMIKSVVDTNMPIWLSILAMKNGFKTKPTYKNSLGKDILYTARATMDGFNAGVTDWGALPESLINEATGGKLNEKTGILNLRDNAGKSYQDSISKIEREPLRRLAGLSYHVPEIAMLQGRTKAGVQGAGKLLSKENAARTGLYGTKRLNENTQDGMEPWSAVANAAMQAATATAMGRSGKGKSIPLNIARSGGAGAATSAANNFADKITGKKKNMKWVSTDEKKPAVFNLPQMKNGAARNVLGSSLTNNLKGKSSRTGTGERKSGTKKITSPKKMNTKAKQGMDNGLNATYERILKQLYKQSKEKK